MRYSTLYRLRVFGVCLALLGILGFATALDVLAQESSQQADAFYKQMHKRAFTLNNTSGRDIANVQEAEDIILAQAAKRASEAANRGLNNLGDHLFGDRFRFKGTLGFSIGEGIRGEMRFGIPIFGTNAGKGAIALQAGLIGWGGHRGRQRTDINIGLVARARPRENGMILGANAFIDVNAETSLARGGVGLDIQHRNLFLALNGYFPIDSGWEESDDPDYQDRLVSGYEMRGTYVLNEKLQLRLAAGGWDNTDVNATGSDFGDLAYGGALGADWQFHKNLALSGNYDFLSYGLGEHVLTLALQAQFPARSKIMGQDGLPTDLFRLVEREHRLLYAQRHKGLFARPAVAQLLQDPYGRKVEEVFLPANTSTLVAGKYRGEHFRVGFFEEGTGRWTNTDRSFLMRLDFSEAETNGARYTRDFTLESAAGGTVVQAGTPSYIFVTGGPGAFNISNEFVLRPKNPSALTSGSRTFTIRMRILGLSGKGDAATGDFCYPSGDQRACYSFAKAPLRLKAQDKTEFKVHIVYHDVRTLSVGGEAVPANQAEEQIMNRYETVREGENFDFTVALSSAFTTGNLTYKMQLRDLLATGSGTNTCAAGGDFANFGGGKITKTIAQGSTSVNHTIPICSDSIAEAKQRESFQIVLSDFRLGSATTHPTATQLAVAKRVVVNITIFNVETSTLPLMTLTWQNADGSDVITPSDKTTATALGEASYKPFIVKESSSALSRRIEIDFGKPLTKALTLSANLDADSFLGSNIALTGAPKRAATIGSSTNSAGKVYISTSAVVSCSPSCTVPSGNSITVPQNTRSIVWNIQLNATSNSRKDGDRHFNLNIGFGGVANAAALESAYGIRLRRYESFLLSGNENHPETLTIRTRNNTLNASFEYRLRD